MAEACPSPYGCEWGIRFLWHWMNWMGHVVVYVLALLLAYCLVVFLRVSWRCCLARRASEIDSSFRTKLVFYLSTAVNSLNLISFTAPYLGLAGTCFGIMSVFRGVDMELHALRAVMAAIIAAALVTTAAGIVLAVCANCFYNYLCTRLELLVSEISNKSFRCKLPLRKLFSEFPAFALIVTPILAMAVAAFMCFASFREPKGFGIEVASGRCEYGEEDRFIVLRITNEGRLFLNSEQQSWNTLSGRLADIYRLRVHRILYLSADDGVPFQTVADAIDFAQNTELGLKPLNITIRLMTPKATNTPCPEPVRISLTQHASP